ncbi:MAG: hypothetical protein AAB336_12690 [Acidobacteriota bacterium]
MKYTLKNFEVKNPCSINWRDMNGNEEIRHCDTCQQKVNNLSEMTKRKSLKILNQPNERVCVTYLQDENNQIITQTYLGNFKRNLVKLGSAVLAIIFSFSSIQAMQTKIGKPKKKKVVKQKKHVKTRPLKRTIGKVFPQNNFR